MLIQQSAFDQAKRLLRDKLLNDLVDIQFEQAILISTWKFRVRVCGQFSLPAVIGTPFVSSFGDEVDRICELSLTGHAISVKLSTLLLSQLLTL